MIIKVILTIIFFLWGIIDSNFGLVVLDNTIYLGLLVYLSFLVINPNKRIWTLYGYFYFLGLSADMPIIGILPFIMVLFEYTYFALQRIITINNKVIGFLYNGIFFGLNYLLVSYIINQFQIIFSLNLLLLVFIFSIIGGIISLFSKKYER